MAPSCILGKRQLCCLGWLQIYSTGERERKRKRKSVKRGKGGEQRQGKKGRRDEKVGKEGLAKGKAKRKEKNSRKKKGEKDGRRKGYLYLQDFFFFHFIVLWFFFFFEGEVPSFLAALFNLILSVFSISLLNELLVHVHTSPESQNKSSSFKWLQKQLA